MIGGIASNLPGVLFSTNAPLFDPALGWTSDAPFTGIATVTSIGGLQLDPVPEPVPEPSSFLLLSTGAVGARYVWRRRNHAK